MARSPYSSLTHPGKPAPAARLRDATGRKQVAELLRQSEERFRAVVNNVPIVLFALDRAGIFTLSEGRALRPLGLRPGAVVGQSVFDVYRDVPEILAHVRRAAAGAEVFATVAVAGRIFDASYTPLRDPQGAVVGVLGVATDVTGHKRAEVELREAHQFLHSALDALSAHIAVLDASGTILAVNAAWHRFAIANGLAATGAGVGMNYLRVCDQAAGDEADDAVAVARGIRRVIAGGAAEFTREYPCHTPTERRWFLARVTRFPGEGPACAVVAHEDITERKRAEEQLLHDAFHDALTGLPNRALLLERLERAHGRADHRFAVLFLDFDRFKTINDSLGHDVGDRFLVAVARRLAGCLSPRDTVARIGGDEFVILLEAIADARDATRVARRIRGALTAPLLLESHALFTTASIGIAVSAPQYTRAEDLLRDADTAMYRAKARGGAQHVVFDAPMHTHAVALLSLESDLRRAVGRREFRLHYQPIVALATGEIAGFEALVRWQHPQRGLVPPGEFLPLAEEAGLMEPISRWVMRTACRQLQRWQREFGSRRPLTMSVNLSRADFLRPNLVPQFGALIREVGVDARALRLEITENGLMGYREGAAAVLAQLRAFGLQVAIDDFGTGYSSLSDLHHLPIDTLKIDRSFLRGMEPDGGDTAIVRTIIALAHQLGLQVVAEGVETEAQRDTLRALGCEYGQGYFFSRAVDGAAAHALLVGQPLLPGPAHP